MGAPKLHILIVDDSPEDRYSVRRLLRDDPTMGRSHRRLTTA
jgi:hypothetical protein